MTAEDTRTEHSIENAAEPWWREHQRERGGTTNMPPEKRPAEPSAVAAQSELSAGETLVIPVIEEELTIEKRIVETGRARIVKTVQEREETYDNSRLQEEVTISRVPVNRPVEGPVPVRTEGDTTIYSVLEEVLVVEKRLVLKEEIHVKRTRHEIAGTGTITLRSEHVEIEHPEVPISDDPGSLSAQGHEAN